MPVAAEVNNGKLVALVELSAVNVTADAYVAVSALPVTAPVKFPENAVEVKIPVDGLYVNPVSVLGERFPVAAEVNNGKLVALVVLSAVSVTALA